MPLNDSPAPRQVHAGFRYQTFKFNERVILDQASLHETEAFIDTEFLRPLETPETAKTARVKSHRLRTHQIAESAAQ